MRILIIEDEPKATAYLKRGLTEAGFTVDVAHDGESGLHSALHESIDAVILDVMLPKRDGWSVLEEMRRRGRTTPVLMLTAKDSVPDRVRGLDLGADDYLVKPFAFSELSARLRSVLRRGARSDASPIRVADLEIDLLKHRAARGERRLDLTPREFSLLELLASRKGEVLGRTEIMERVWDMHFDPGTNVIDVHIRRLRAKVDDPFPLKLIHTVRGVGYVLEPRRGADGP